VSCRQRQAQDTLVRVTHTDGQLVPDAPPGARRRPGRGAYLCGSATCLERALAREALLLRRALRSEGPCTVSEELSRIGPPMRVGAPETSDGASAS